MSMILYHVTTPKKAKRYRDSGHILKPVRGFTTLQAAMLWALYTGRNVIYEVDSGLYDVWKLPDHHNKYGDAYWIEGDVPICNVKNALKG